MKTSTMTKCAFALILVLCCQVSISYGQNIAKDKQVDQDSNDPKYPTSNIFNGNKEDFGTTNSSTNPWVQVDLGQIYDITRVDVWRNEYDPEKTRRFNDAYIAISNDPFFGNCSQIDCFTYQKDPIYKKVPSSGSPMNVRFQGVSGRYVRFYTSKHLLIAELEVFGTVSEINDQLKEAEAKAQNAEATQKAISSGDSKQMKALVSAGNFDMSSTDLHKMCIDNKDTEVLQAALAKNKSVSDATMNYALSKYNKNVIHTLISKGNVDITTNVASTVIAKNDLKSLKAIGNKDKSALKTSHLSEALTSNKIEIAEYLVDNDVRAGGRELTLAITKGHNDMATTMMENGTNPTAQHLNEAIKSGNDNLMNMLLPKVRPNSESYILAARANNYDLYESLVSKSNVPNNASLEVAIDNNNMEILSEGLSYGGNANEALKYAISKKKIDAINKCLNKKSADVNIAIPYAVTNNNTELINKIIAKGGDADKILDEAIKVNKPAMMQIALETDQTAPEKHLKTVIESGHDAIAKLMIDKGADPNKGMLPAITKDNKTLVEYFLENNADGTNSMYIKTSSASSLDITELLLNYGAKADDGMVSAAENDKTQIVEILLSNGGIPDLGLKPALKLNHTATAKLLIQNGATPTGVIDMPSGFGNTEIVTLLLETGADPQNGMLAACKNGRTSVLNILLEYGADGNQSKYMAAAVEALHAGLIPILFDQGIDPTAKYPDGGTYIHAAAKMPGCLNTVMALIKGGVPVAGVDNVGNTALHVAVMQGKENATVIKALVGGGTDVNAQNNKGETPLKVAKNRKTKKTLKDLGGVKNVK